MPDQTAPSSSRLEPPTSPHATLLGPGTSPPAGPSPTHASVGHGSPSRSPTRSLSLSARSRGRGTGASFAGTVAFTPRGDMGEPLQFGALLKPPSNPSSPSAPTTQGIHTDPSGSSPPLRRAVSEEDAHARAQMTATPTRDGHRPVASDPLDAQQAALLQSARIKMSSRDQEAMRKLRSSMKEHSDSGSSTKSNSPRSPLFPSTAQMPTQMGIGVGVGGPSTLRPRRSTLSRQLTREDTSRDSTEEGEEDEDDDGEEGNAENKEKEGLEPQLEQERTPRPPVFDRHDNNLPRSSADYVIAVIGHQGVGKSTVIRRALKAWGMSNPVTVRSSQGFMVSSCFSHVQPGGKLKHPWKVEFVEMDIRSLDVTSVPPAPAWPSIAPAVSGAIVCYDAGHRDTLDGIAPALHRLAQDGLPVVMFACKSDPDGPIDIEPAYGNSIGEPYNVGLIEVTTVTSEGKSKMRNGLRWLLYKLEQRQRRHQRKLLSSHSHPHPTEAASDHALPTQPHPPVHSAHPLSSSASSSRSGPRRATPPDILTPSHSEMISRMPMPTPPASAISADLTSQSHDSDASSGAERLMYRRGLGMTPGRDGTRNQNRGRNRDRDRREHDPGSDTRSSSSSLQWMMRAPIGQAGGAEMTQVAVDAVPVKQVGETTAGGSVEREGSIPASVERSLYVSLEDLLGQLFAAIISNEDDTFVRSFLMTYRRFCTPLELMREFLDRFREVEQYAVSKDIKLWSLMKITGGLIDWTSRYPGDVVDEDTQSLFRELVATTLRHTFMAHLAAELVQIEQTLYSTIDIDRSWALGGRASSSRNNDDPLPSSTGTELVIDNDVLYELDSSVTPSDSERLTKESTPSTKSMSTSSLGGFDTDSAMSMSMSAGLGAAAPPLPRNGSGSGSGSESRLMSGWTADDRGEDLGFARWAHAFAFVVNSDPRVFAVELTRMQWRLFSDIRPRDVLRHDLGKERDGPVGKFIIFFNHLSRWVTTLILANPKPKHRARAYERFMLVAHQLRRLNNYDSLYAVISGMRETSVHRLAATHSLVQVGSGVQKEWQSHLRLMDPRGGYGTYRKALAADMSHGSPAIPLMTTLLGMVNRLQAIRPEDVRQDGMVQWDKFAKFGEYLGVIPECQARGSMVPGEPSSAFRALIEDTPIITNEDGLFERSKMLEPGGGQVNAGVNMFKRLANLGL